MIVMTGVVAGEKAVHHQTVVMAVFVRVTRVQVHKRGRGHVHQHAETHEQDEAEPFHLGPIVSDPFCLVKMGGSYRLPV